SSADAARLFSNVFKKGVESTRRKLDYWDRLFMSAEDLAGQKVVSHKKADRLTAQIARLIIPRDEKMLRLAKDNLTLEEFLNIKSRMIGTGFIGGKSAGMLIARKIILKEKSLGAEKFFEPHDSFYIGSDVFYTYIVENGWWNERMEQRTKEGYFKIARALKEKLLHGLFPEEIKEQFQQMIDYFGQSPIIVRSSSLLEDSYGNAFAGKYESIFLANQGTPAERYARFVEAVQRVYASTMNEDALAYRLKRGLDRMDEQMALLVQRVSGSHRKEYFFPDVAGVGISHNVFVWKNTMDPKAGMLRLVLGLGTRAVNRVEGDYPRIVALDEPLLKVHAGIKDTQRFSQHNVDVLNMKENAFQTVPLKDLLVKKMDLNLDLIATKDYESTERLHDMGSDQEAWVITFDKLLSEKRFRIFMQKILRALEESYEYPVDIEFTVNFKNNGEFQLNLLQCRPMQTKGLGHRVNIPKEISKKKTVFESNGSFLGGNIALAIDRIIYVDPKAYCGITTQSGKYDIARIVGDINRQIPGREKMAVMLLGPGRWGTSTPSLGVPVSFSEIDNISVLGEIAFSGNNVMPELSYGTHFFQDLVETGIFYLALFPQNKGVYINQKYFDSMPATLSKIFPQYKRYDNVIKIFDIKGRGLKIVADIMTQRLACYFR
ncbi:MAG: PEP/pyruvate-binding domain-containing protein, partial [Candidatus Omnitrophica bacterium]|nr:PEP/pyruvate-binding domain-containing protein [Candidatus Omnitrophota bacterium]